MARAALNNFCVGVICLGLCGCFFSSGAPTYTTKNIAFSLNELAKAEYQIDITSRLVGSTLWVYMPVEDLFIKSPQPAKYSEKFQILANTGSVKDGRFTGEYHIKPVPPKDKSQDYKINKKVSEQIGILWKVIRRVVFSIEPSQRGDIEFVVMAVGDIKNGFKVTQVFYVRDLKKVSYNLMSIWEFQHRVIQDSMVSPLVIGDRTGRHLEYRDFTMAEFVEKQIEYRVSLKFQKPEVEQNVDIDREILRIIKETLRMYEMTDVEEVSFRNLELDKNVTLGYPALWGKPGRE